MTTAKRPMPECQAYARLLAHAGFDEKQTEDALRKHFPTAPIDELVDEAFAHKDHVDEELGVEE